jgi:hypothetical protein
MQAIALSVVLMSSACGHSAASSTDYGAKPAAVVCESGQQLPGVSCVPAPRDYDSGRGLRYVAPLSSRRRSASSER